MFNSCKTHRSSKRQNHREYANDTRLEQLFEKPKLVVSPPTIQAFHLLNIGSDLVIRDRGVELKVKIYSYRPSTEQYMAIDAKGFMHMVEVLHDENSNLYGKFMCAPRFDRETMAIID